MAEASEKCCNNTNSREIGWAYKSRETVYTDVWYTLCLFLWYYLSGPNPAFCMMLFFFVFLTETHPVAHAGMQAMV